MHIKFGVVSLKKEWENGCWRTVSSLCHIFPHNGCILAAIRISTCFIKWFPIQFFEIF